MKVEYFISSKLFRGNKRFSSIVVNLAFLSIVLGIIVMIISIGIAQGFQNAIKDKVAGFEGHIRVSKFDFNQSFELNPISLSKENIIEIDEIEDVESVNTFCLKGGIIKKEKLIEGIVLKGVDHNFRWDFFDNYLIRGRIPKFNDTLKSNEVLVSKIIAEKTLLDTGTTASLFFIQDPPRVRRVEIVGIYDTGFEEFDRNYLIGDIKIIQKLNDWTENQVSGLEVHLSDYSKAEIVNKHMLNVLDYDIKSETLIERYPMIIDWLNLLDTNVYFIIGLMVLISGITIIATLLILILEKTTLIGILKALGAKNSLIRKIFIIRTLRLILGGVLAGNIIGISIGWLQKTFQLIPLDAKNYYMSTVPFDITITQILLLNSAVLMIIFIMIIWPSTLISRISPAKSIRFK